MTVEMVLSMIRAQGALIGAMADLLEALGAEPTQEIADLFESAQKAQGVFEAAVAAQEKKESSNSGRAN